VIFVAFLRFHNKIYLIIKSMFGSLSYAAIVAGCMGFLLGCVLMIAVFYMDILSGKSTKKKINSRSRSIVKSTSSSIIANDDHVNFLSDLISRLWNDNLSVGLGDTIRETVEPMFADMGLPSLRFVKFDMGRVPIQLDNIVVHHLNDEGNTLQFDVDVTWDGACDIKAKSKVLPPFGIANIELKGRMSFFMKPLSNVLPCFGAVQYSFTNTPELDLDFTGMAAIANSKTITNRVKKILDDILASMIVLPNRMLLKVDPSCTILDAFVPPLGIARITAIRGRGFVIEKRGFLADDVPDVYLEITLADRVCKTSVIWDALEPVWKESSDFLLCDHGQIVNIQAYDRDPEPYDPDDDLGSVQITVGEIILAGQGEEVELELQMDGKGTDAYVAIKCDVLRFTSSPTSYHKPLENANHLAGLLTIAVVQALKLPLSKEDAASHVKISYGSEHTFETGVVTEIPGYDSLNPYYDCIFHVPITKELVSSGLPSITFEILNNNKTSLGKLLVDNSELESSQSKIISDTREIGEGGALLNFRISLSGVNLETSQPKNEGERNQTVQQKNINSAPAVSITIARGTNFQMKKRRVRKTEYCPNLYCVVRVGSSPQRWRTSTIFDSVLPNWDESKEFPTSSRNNVINVDVFDQKKKSFKKSPDEYIGQCRVTVGQVLLDGGIRNAELMSDGKKIGAFIEMECKMK